ncbi:MAG: DinB family protein [Pyrinomonadaceae bacterium]
MTRSSNSGSGPQTHASRHLDPVIHSFGYCLEYLRDQVSDVDDITAVPAAVANHPAWTVGHPIYVCQLLGGVVGLEPWLPDDWESRYGSGSKPVADAGSYESKQKLLEMLDDARSRFVAALARVDDADLELEFPVPEYRAVFPTVRHSLTQVLVGHTAFHVGQVSVWRQAMGLPGIGRSFD